MQTTANIGDGPKTLTQLGQEQVEANTPKPPDLKDLPEVNRIGKDVDGSVPTPAPAPAPAPAAPAPAPAPAAAPESATGGTEAAPATEATGTAPATTPATGGTSTAAKPAAGGDAVNPKVQDMAQQFQAGQDMQTIQQGKGAGKTYLKISGLGMLADAATFGLTSRFGSTGSAARRKANEQSEQQTKDYQAARSRMNQRAMGMTPVMTSLDSQLSMLTFFLSEKVFKSETLLPT